MCSKGGVSTGGVRAAVMGGSALDSIAIALLITLKRSSFMMRPPWFQGWGTYLFAFGTLLLRFVTFAAPKNK